MRPSRLHRLSEKIGSSQIGGLYDLCVLGGGQAGLAAAVRGWDFGKRLCVVNDGPIGGATINGALSSKTFWQLSRQYRHHSNIASRYISSPNLQKIKPCLSKLQENVQEAMEFKRQQMVATLEGLREKKRYSAKEDGGGGSVHLFQGVKGKFITPNILQLTPSTASCNPPSTSPSPSPLCSLKPADDGHYYIQAENFLIATGSRPRTTSQVAQADGKYILTSDDIPYLTSFPESLLILGAGVIGCEYATIFGNLNNTQVHLINEKRQRLLPHEDQDLSDYIEGSFRKSNVHLHNNVRVLDMQVIPSENCVQVDILPLPSSSSSSSAPATPKRLKVSKVLLAIGRLPNTDSLGLQEIGIPLRPDGGVEVTPSLSIPSHPHIFAAGDVTVDVGLVSVAEMEARHAVEVMFGLKSPSTILSYNSVSSIMFFRPEVACVGLNETEARRQGIPHKVAYLNLSLMNRTVIDWNLSHVSSSVDASLCGYIKMLALDGDFKRLLGMRAVSVDASSLIEPAALLISRGEGVGVLEQALHPHPSITEALVECTRLLTGRSLYKPHVFPELCKVTHYHQRHGVVPATEQLNLKRTVIPSYIGGEGGAISKYG